MSSPRLERDRDGDRDSLTDWTLVDREGTPDKTTRGGQKKDDDKDSGQSSSSPTVQEDEVEKEKQEVEGDGAEEEEDGEEELSEDLISMGQKVQEIKASLVIRYQRISEKIPAFLVSVSNPLFTKASSGSDSSDIETLDCPGPDEYYEEHTPSYDSLHSSLLSSSLSGFTFVGAADEGDVESLASSDVQVLDHGLKVGDEETDLSLASSPSLPDDLPAIKPDTQYRHTPDRELNSRLNVVVALTLACVLGLGLGHFLGLVALSGDEAPKGWSSRSLWQENLNSAQIIEALNVENEELKAEIIRLQQLNISPIKISGKDGKQARDLRERINRLLVDNEELRVAVAKEQFAGLPEGDIKAFNAALKTNYKLRLGMRKLTHLGPDLTALKVSANDLQRENQELQKNVGKLRYQEQPLPQELNAVVREVESLKRAVEETSRKKKVPTNYENAKIYLSYMSQVLQTLHEFREGGLVEKIDVATDAFEGLVPGNVKPSADVVQKMNSVRAKFSQLRSSLALKWEKVKELSQPDNLAKVSQDTLTKMNRVIANVVNKMKDIGQASILKRGKASLDSTTSTLAQSLAALGDQFDKTWTKLEAQVSVEGEDNGSEIMAEEEEVEDITGGVVEEVTDAAEAGKREARDRGEDTPEVASHGPDNSKKGDRRSGGTGGGGGGGGGKKGGDENKKLEGKKSDKKNVDKKERNPDGRRESSKRGTPGDKGKKEEHKREKAMKEKEEKKKKKEDKKHKKEGKNKENKDPRHQGDGSGRHHRDSNNKYDHKHQQFDNDDDLTRKHKRKPVYDDDDDDDSDYEYSKKYHKKGPIGDSDDDDDDDDERKKGLSRHWEKPSKKNYRREYPGPKKAFIRRRDN